jgi:hypothetical protein
VGFGPKLLRPTVSRLLTAAPRLQPLLQATPTVAGATSAANGARSRSGRKTYVGNLRNWIQICRGACPSCAPAAPHTRAHRRRSSRTPPSLTRRQMCWGCWGVGGLFGTPSIPGRLRKGQERLRQSRLRAREAHTLPTTPYQLHPTNTRALGAHRPRLRGAGRPTLAQRQRLRCGAAPHPAAPSECDGPKTDRALTCSGGV